MKKITKRNHSINQWKESSLYLSKAICRQLLKTLYIFPVKNNRILFEAYSGKGYVCNPKYIYECINQKFPGKFEMIWVFEQPDSIFDGKVCIKRNLIQYCYLMLTSKVIITNMGFNAFLPFRKKQLKFNTWHGGGAYKRMGLDMPCSETEQRKTIQNGKETDLILSTNKKFSRCFSHAYRIPIKKMWEIGMPRNDLLLSDHSNQKDKVFQMLKLNKNQKLAIYAPTFRGDFSNANPLQITLNSKKCLDSLNKRFGGEWILGIRMHHAYHTQGNPILETIDLSEYSDMQELLLAADALITDYSSCMWDFSLTGKPCFIYATDSEEYKNSRNFYIPMSYWPFPIANNNDELVQNIINYNEKSYDKKVKKHHKQLGICETGHASELVTDLIYDYCFKNISKDKLIKKNN